MHPGAGVTGAGGKTLAWLAGRCRELADALANRRARSYALGFLAGLKRDVREAFGSAVDPVTGRPWQPVTYRAGPPLILTGALRAAAFAAVDTARPSGMGVTVQLSTPAYGVFHQFGTGRIPQRRFLGPSARTVQEARRQFAGEVVKILVG